MWHTRIPRKERSIWLLNKITRAALVVLPILGMAGVAPQTIAEADRATSHWADVGQLASGKHIASTMASTVGESPTREDGLGFADPDPKPWMVVDAPWLGEDPDVAHLDRLLSDWGRAVPVTGCYDCNICGFWRNKHRVDGNPPPSGGYEAAHVEGCNGDGTCADHETCGMTQMAEALGEITRAVRWAESEVLAAVVDRHPEWMRINRDRQALQLVGCEGSIVASYPATSLPALAGLLQ